MRFQRARLSGIEQLGPPLREAGERLDFYREPGASETRPYLNPGKRRYADTFFLIACRGHLRKLDAPMLEAYYPGYYHALRADRVYSASNRPEKFCCKEAFRGTA